MAPVRTFVWGFSQEFSPVINCLKRQKVCNVAVWVGTDPQCTHALKDFMMPDLNFVHQSPVSCPIPVYDQVYPHLWTYMDMMARENREQRHSLHEMLHLFNQQLDVYYYLLTHYEVDLVLFDRIPHTGPDKILYETAKALGIKTILLHPSLFPDRFFFTYDVADFGRFRDIPELNDYERLTIERKYEKALPYHVTFPDTAYGWTDVISDYFKSWDGRVFDRYDQYRDYVSNLNRLTTESVDFNRDYVYFPLHYQPEVTASALGGIYTDQLLALERLSEALPEGWTIYVKENPYQSELMRGPGFFDRLERIRKVVMVPRNLSTYVLIRNARFVATVSGTVGWEAITGGKNVLVFGKAWYLNCPGVFRFDEPFQLDEILNTRIAHDQLEDAFSWLMTMTGRGEIGWEIPGMDNPVTVDPQKNGTRVAASLEKMIAGLLMPDVFVERVEAIPA